MQDIEDRSREGEYCTLGGGDYLCGDRLGNPRIGAQSVPRYHDILVGVFVPNRIMENGPQSIMWGDPGSALLRPGPFGVRRWSCVI